jgi:hypothetical protein
MTFLVKESAVAIKFRIRVPHPIINVPIAGYWKICDKEDPAPRPLYRSAENRRAGISYFAQPPL